MPDLTTTEAAAYLAERGYAIGRRWHGGRGPISARTLRKWCEAGKLEGAVKVGEGNRAVWKIPQSELDKLLEAVVGAARATVAGPDSTNYEWLAKALDAYDKATDRKARP